MRGCAVILLFSTTGKLGTLGTKGRAGEGNPIQTQLKPHELFSDFVGVISLLVSVVASSLNIQGSSNVTTAEAS